MLTCSGVTVRYRVGETTTTPLRDVGLFLPGGATALMGPSGSGKSTLLRVLAGLQQPTAGAVEIDGRAVSWSRRDPTMDPGVVMVHQDYALVGFLSVADNLQLTRQLRGMPKARPADLEAALATVGLGGYGPRMPRTLSGGEQQRVAIARATLVEATVLLADEPTGSLDDDNSQVVADVLRDLGEQHGVVVLVATHDSAVAATLGTTLQLAALNGAEEHETVA